ncbi:MAG: M14 family zinc carboxypeptidase [Myxococcota bacterium]|nr:M14 family zinc carboxypeptidase [Myxococcota bacterium]
MLPMLLAGILTAPPLETVAERTRYVQSGRYDEVIGFCKTLAELYPAKARCDVFGTTPEGRPMHVLTLAEDGGLTPDDARAKGRHVVLAQGAIHAGELDGKDAGLALARDLLEGKTAPGLLGRVTLVFVPVYNVDGHENVAPANRPNQLGPETPGFRVTAQRLNLNRDYAKADTPETRAMLALLRKWDPLVYVDLHTTNGMDFQPDVAIMVEPRFGWAAAMREAGDKVSSALMTKLRTAGHLPLDFYPSAEDETRPLSGWANGVASPRFSQAYWPQWHRFGVLVESHALKSNARRVRASRDALLGVLEVVRDDGAALTAASNAAQVAMANIGGTEVALAFAPTGTPKVIEFRGVAYKELPSVITGKRWVQFDPSRPKLWKTPMLRDVAPSLTVKAPRGGYIVPPPWVAVVSPVLAAHGITTKLVVNGGSVGREVFQASTVKVAPRTTEGRTRVEIAGSWRAEKGDILPGSLYVPIAQRGGVMAMHLLEPQAPDSLVTWGFMNAVFEAREYVELMVLEPFAQKLLAADAQVKKEFDALVKSGASEAERIDFFYRRHPAHDRLRDAYPVVRVDAAVE